MNYTVTAVLTENPHIKDCPFSVSAIVNERPDVPVRSGYGCSSREDAQIYIDAINAQQVYKNLQIKTDVHGVEYFSCTTERPPAVQAQMGKTIRREVTSVEADAVAAAHASGSDPQQWCKIAFTQCQNPHDWKAPIDVTVPTSVVSLYAQAITHFTATGTYQTPSQDGSRIRLRSVGYRMGPAGP